MITRDDLPETPDWLPESRDGKVRARVVKPLSEAIAAWDRDWTTWAGDDG